MLIAQVAAALLLVLGSGLILKALIEIDAPNWPRPSTRRRLPHVRSEEDLQAPLDRAA